jgi:hypothetical protein
MLMELRMGAAGTVPEDGSYWYSARGWELLFQCQGPSKHCSFSESFYTLKAVLVERLLRHYGGSPIGNPVRSMIFIDLPDPSSRTSL